MKVLQERLLELGIIMFVCKGKRCFAQGTDQGLVFIICPSESKEGVCESKNVLGAITKYALGRTRGPVNKQERDFLAQFTQTVLKEISDV